MGQLSSSIGARHTQNANWAQKAKVKGMKANSLKKPLSQHFWPLCMGQSMNCLLQRQLQCFLLAILLLRMNYVAIVTLET